LINSDTRRISRLKLSTLFPEIVRKTQKTRSLNFRIQGGLGNQLANISALIYFADSFGVDFNLDIAHLQHHGGDWQNSFLGLTLVQPQVMDMSLREKLFSARGLTCNCSSRYVSRLGRFKGKNLSSDDAGFISTIPNRIFKTQYFGDFQSYRYFQYVKFLAPAISVSYPLSPSSIFLQNLRQIMSTPSLGIHFRAGDYKTDPELWGLLNQRYYENAIRLLGGRDKHKVFIFSDDLSFHRELIGKLQMDLDFMLVDSRLSATETHSLFSNCADKIIANSSFSWSAALMSSREMVCYPFPWFPVKKKFSDQFPSHWMPVDSHF
jgi:Glycosyl transferase family 11